MNVRDLLRALDGDGWYLARGWGSHRQSTQAATPGLVTVAMSPAGGE
jgi:predicted RNA binding protein YcfA (HicA-like mRNA interferase family)